MAALRRPNARQVAAIAVGSAFVIGVGSYHLQTSSLENALTQDRVALAGLGIRLRPGDFGRAVPLETNASPDYLRAHELISLKDVRSVEIRYGSDGKETPESIDRVERWANENEALLKLAAEASSKPVCAFARNWSLGLTLKFDEYASVRILARLSLAKARVESDRGDLNASLRWIGVALRISEHLGSEPGLISLLISSSCESQAVAALQRLITLNGADPTFRQRATELLHSLRPPPSTRDALEWEVATQQAALEELATGTQSTDGLWGATSSRRPWLTRYFRISYLRLRVSRLLLDRHLEFFQSTKGAGPRGVWKAMEKLDKSFDSDRSVYGGLAILFVPTYSLAGAVPLAMEARRRMSLVGLWLKQEQARTGTYPPRLPTEAWAVDPFSEQPFIYSSLENQFTLYSIGPDLRDDGGRIHGSTVGTRRIDDIEFNYGYRRMPSPK